MVWRRKRRAGFKKARVFVYVPKQRGLGLASCHVEVSKWCPSSEIIESRCCIGENESSISFAVRYDWTTESSGKCGG